MPRLALGKALSSGSAAGILAVALLAPQTAAGQTANTTPLPASATADAAQDQPAILVADQVFLEGKTRLVAEGQVEALQGDVRIRASRIAYDRETDRLTITGPITILQGDDTIILADAAEMDEGYRNGLLTGARMVLQQQVQLAAHRIDRVDGRYSQLYKAAVTSCQVCNAESPPLWQIRARRLIHDQQERQLYFEDAQLRVMDMPIFYLPRLRLPDPTLDRATGFLIPTIKGNSELGTGPRIPYFIKLGDSRDLTVAPFLTKNTRTLELAYRQAFRNGKIEFEGAVSSDSLTTYDHRAYLFGEGSFNLPRDFKLEFSLQTATDKTYLEDYSFSDEDLLESGVTISRTKRDSYFGVGLKHYQSLRVPDDNSTIPSIIGDIEYERRYFPRALGGELRFSTGLHSHYRYSDLDYDSADTDTITDGRDVTRIDAEVLWLRNWTLPSGILAGVEAGFAADQFYTADDSSLPASDAGITPMAAVTLRWPWMKITSNGATHVIEPVVQLGWSGGSNLNVANDESTRVEFDEGNLLSLSRFTAPDRRERGWRAAYGLNWTRLADDWQHSLTLGQIVREDSDTNFSTTSGLRGTTSDLLVAGQIKTKSGLSLTARTLFDSDFSLAKTEARGVWQSSRFGLGASYVWLGPDTQEDRTSTVSEWSVDGLYRISRHWIGSASVSYDVAAQQASEASMDLTYRNECVEVELSVSRRYTSSTILTPSTDFSVTVGLRGFNAETTDASYRRRCN
ncbi:LPS-assembly protein LptD [Rhodalgimonas zhirmunskyi]|nr:LPS assembly protein LptD [Rhodoalgimonas zhirmunskyi]